ncbi:ribonuclease H-like protein [Daldinia caldariorum]|uniref:ribonuclease H-like protein n=1 Tax=Daldinia caldariorum TaxID=326644 RepID=UPI0020089750|nr:ribonuclease H-like protein [Daldinia caldariorum]KAI1466332.1 ribonuclease H-like protein [Daldinia caldariorum]
MSFGSSELVGNTLRSSQTPRMSPFLRSWAGRTLRMTTSPPKSQIWHPARGISFSSVTRSPNLAPQDPESLNQAAAFSHQTQSSVLSVSNGLRASPYSKVEKISLSGVKRKPRKSKKATPEVTETADGSSHVALADGQTESSKVKTSDHPPVATLPFKMVEELFYAAKKAPAGTPASYWSYTQYRGMTEDGKEERVKVHYCRSTYTMEKICKDYFSNEKILGFDLEWAADSYRYESVKKNVSLIQLASPSRIGLFHVALFPDKDDLVGPTFRAIMEDPFITKVGVNIKSDATRIRNFLSIDSKGLIELSHLYKLVTYSAEGRQREINKKLVPLATQVEHYLHLPLYKGTDVRTSDWTKPLSFDQVTYSGSDAYAGLQLFATLDHHRQQLRPCPPPPYHAELNLPIRLADGLELSTDDEPAVEAVVETVVEATVIATETTTTATATSTAKSKTTSKRSSAPKDSRVEIAEDRVARYRATHPESVSSMPQLRAYFMWHNQGLDLATIARLLRDPPLKVNTITVYILAAIEHEKLPVDKERLEEEIAIGFLESTLKARWPYVASVLGYT